jgi:hypothetical protein
LFDRFDGKEGTMGHSGHGRFGVGRGERGEVAAGSVGDEVAHARARFAVDPATPTRLADAWKAPTGATEEDESELIDAVADCLSVGLPLDAAVASWRSGSLQISSEPDEDDDDETGVFGEDADTGVYDPRRPSGRRRIIET